MNTIVAMLKDTPEISMQEIADSLGANIKTIKRDFEQLKEENILVRRGGRKIGFWEIIENTI